MADMYLVIEGENADSAADALTAVLAEDEMPAVIVRSRTSQPSGATNKLFDPVVSVITITLAIPTATFAIVNLTKLANEKKAEKKANNLIKTARRVQYESKVRITVRTQDGRMWDFERLEAGELIEMANTEP